MPSSVETFGSDHYAVLGVQHSATQSQITSAYRKQALKCHPDKNPNNSSSVESFHKLSHALDILSDPATRSAFDRIFEGRNADLLQSKKLNNDNIWRFKEDFNTGDAFAAPSEQPCRGVAERRKYEQERRRFKEELEAKEKAALIAATQRKQAAEELKREKERLRQAGIQFQAEQDKLRQGLQNISLTTDETELDVSLILYLKWRSKKVDPKSVSYSVDLLKDIFSKYGPVSEVVLSPKKKGRAIVEFATESAAQRALQHERGLANNPLSVTRISNPINVISSSTANYTFERTASQINESDIIDFEKLKI